MTPMSFSSVLNLARIREPEALQCICITYHPIVLRYVSRHVPPQVVDDITQDIFLKMVTDINMLRADNEAEFKAWLFAIVYTAIAAYHRRSQRVHVVPIDDMHDIVSPDDPTMPLLEAEKNAAVMNVISMLTTKHRKIVLGRAHGQDYKAIARATGMKEVTVRSAHHRTLLSMKKELSHLIVIVLVCTSMIAIFSYSVSRARPDSPLYPLRQIFSGGSPDNTPVPRYRPVATPMMTPTPTVQPSPTLTPSPTATSKAPVTTPTTAPSGGILNSVATALPVTSNSSTPVACVIAACISLP